MPVIRLGRTGAGEIEGHMEAGNRAGEGMNVPATLASGALLLLLGVYLKDIPAWIGWAGIGATALLTVIYVLPARLRPIPQVIWLTVSTVCLIGAAAGLVFGSRLKVEAAEAMIPEQAPQSDAAATPQTPSIQGPTSPQPDPTRSVRPLYIPPSSPQGQLVRASPDRKPREGPPRMTRDDARRLQQQEDLSVLRREWLEEMSTMTPIIDVPSWPPPQSWMNQRLEKMGRDYRVIINGEIITFVPGPRAAQPPEAAQPDSK